MTTKLMTAKRNDAQLITITDKLFSRMKSSTIKTILWVTIFAIAMGFLETSVVVYLRKLYYPEGFKFPLKIIDNDIITTEFFRELATMVMLIGISILTGRNTLEKFAYFIYTFAIWDIFYYVFLKLLLNWPESLLTWDILFLVPFSWVGPVITPVINSLTMIVLAWLIIYFTDKRKSPKTGFLTWSLLILGSLIVIIAYTQDYVAFMMKQFTIGQLLSVTNSKEMLALAIQYIPVSFNWLLFMVGVLMHFGAIVLFFLKNKMN